MNYPIWDLTHIGGSSLVALIAVLHVYISHLAVGGGLFIWLTDRKAVRDRDPQVLGYVRSHTWFFLLLTMVFGGVSGVGIWFVIALVQPAATSTLIHTFVFGWAIEWVFFVGEIAALLIYHYRFHVLSESDRLRVAFLYFLFAWLSLVIINGILSFMLTPGAWLTTGGFWDGFFNPTYFSSVAFRSFMSCMIAGIFGYVTLVRLRDGSMRQKMLAYAGRWILYPFAGLLLSAWWYYGSVPADVRARNFGLNPQMVPTVEVFIVTTVAVVLFAGLLGRRMQRPVQIVLAGLLLVTGLGWIGAFEYTREIARKPFIIGDHMYATSIAVKDVPRLNREGVLSEARWVDPSLVRTDRAAVGRELFRLECQSCHTIGGVRNDIAQRVVSLTYRGLISQLTGEGRVQTYMPPFVGTRREAEDLAYYLATVINKRGLDTALSPYVPPVLHDSVPAFDARTSDYALFVWNDLGMHCLSDGDDYFCFLPPANTLEAQVIKRGDPPELLRDNVVLEYQVELGHEHPSRHSHFWKNAASLFGKSLPDDVGLFGKGLAGTFDFDSARGGYVAPGVPVVPYRDDGTYNAFPLFTVTARDRASGKVLAQTAVVAPVSTEIGCRNCHGGGWRIGNAGLAEETSINILRAHDRLNKTDLLARAQAGHPALCQSCHADPALGSPGQPEVMNFSSAMHGWHASYMPYQDSRACRMCHPASPVGNTRCLRDPHGALDVGCTDCHGTMSEHAASLILGQQVKPMAARLLAPLQSAGKVNVLPRVPWENETDCENCHTDFQKPATGAKGSTHWTEKPGDLYRRRTDVAGMRCPACHGSTHAIYPSRNAFFRDRDNMQALQYTHARAPIGSAQTCIVCHRKPMTDAIHHPNMERAFRNASLLTQ
jgi:hypothetical protein